MRRIVAFSAALSVILLAVGAPRLAVADGATSGAELDPLHAIILEGIQHNFSGDWDAAERLDRMIRCHLKDLKATKIAREGDAAQGPETTPAEWATALLEKLAESQKKPAGKSAKRRKTQK